jgi:hypothetical protein
VGTKYKLIEETRGTSKLYKHGLRGFWKVGLSVGKPIAHLRSIHDMKATRSSVLIISIIYC